jgi:hypothetical protein
LKVIVRETTAVSKLFRKSIDISIQALTKLVIINLRGIWWEGRDAERGIQKKKKKVGLNKDG